MAGILGYGASIPQCRIAIEEIFDMWPYPYPPDSIKALLGLVERAVNRQDEDPCTMATDAVDAAMEMAGMGRAGIGALYFGSFTNPYVTKSSGITVAEVAGLSPDIRCADIQYGGKSGTAALDIILAQVESGRIRCGVAIGSDSVSKHCRPNDAMEFAAGAGAAAFVIGNGPCLADIESFVTYNTDTADFFRVDGDRYLRRGFAEEEEFVGYEDHVKKAVHLFFETTNSEAGDYRYAAISQLQTKRTYNLGETLGFSRASIEPGMLVDRIGYAGSASALLGLCAILDRAAPGDRILVASYGYGAGCDVIGVKVRAEIEAGRKRLKAHPTLQAMLDDKVMVDYKTYVKMERKILHEYD
jgi:2-acetylphloroglucinol acetyltransferase